MRGHIGYFAESIGDIQKREIGDLNGAPGLFLKDERQIARTLASDIDYVPVGSYHLPADKTDDCQHKARRQTYYQICFAFLFSAKFWQAGHNRIPKTGEASPTHATGTDDTLPRVI